MTARHKQRWALEVNIMKKLDHSNVIGARDVPAELDVGPDDLPLLAMEYCSGGDLRKVSRKSYFIHIYFFLFCHFLQNFRLYGISLVGPSVLVSFELRFYFNEKFSFYMTEKELLNFSCG